MSVEMEKKYPDYKFVDSIHGASVGIHNNDVPNVEVSFSNYKLPAGAKNPKNFVRGIANVDISVSPNNQLTKDLLLLVYLKIDELPKKLTIYKLSKVDNKTWDKLTSRQTKEIHGEWAGYLKVRSKDIGDPPIAVG